MSQANALNLQFPVDVAHGGTGVNTLPLHEVLLGNGVGGIASLPLTDGQLLIGSTGASPVAAALTAGSGISITNAAGAVTISAISTQESWSAESAAFSIEANKGYVANAALVATLPLSASLGDSFELLNLNTGSVGSVVIAQNAGQSIRFGDQVTTAGVAGSLTSSLAGDSVRVICVDGTAGAEVFMVASSVGTWYTA